MAYKKKLYAMVAFSKEGYFRSFASGYNKVEIKRIVQEAFDEGQVAFTLTDKIFMKKMPSKYLESYYWKMSKNSNDMIQIMTALTRSDDVRVIIDNKNFSCDTYLSQTKATRFVKATMKSLRSMENPGSIRAAITPDER